MKNILLITLFALSGCVAIPPIPLSGTINSAYMVDFGKIDIENYASSRSVKPTEGIYYSGWLRAGDDGFKPSFHEAFAGKLKGGLKATGRGNPLEIVVIDSAFYLDSKVSDSVVFVGLLTLGRDRPYKCTAVLNLKSAGKSERKEFEHIEMTNSPFDQIKDKTGFISACQDKLLAQLTDHLKRGF